MIDTREFFVGQDLLMGYWNGRGMQVATVQAVQHVLARAEVHKVDTLTLDVEGVAVTAKRMKNAKACPAGIGGCLWAVGVMGHLAYFSRELAHREHHLPVFED